VNKQQLKQIAKHIIPIVGIDPTMKKYWDNTRENHINIFKVDDPINSDINFYGTIGLSANNVIIRGVEQKFGLELLIGGNKKHTEIPNILATCSFYILKDKWECKPDTVFERMVEMYYEDKAMQHIYFTDPFVWQDKLKPLQLEDKKVVWLLAVPISDNELNFKVKNGNEAFEQLK